MAIRSDATHWGSLAKFFHWAVVLLILAQGILGLVMVELPKRPDVIAVYTFHKSLGLTILALAMLRLGWRLFDRRPDEPPTVPHWQAIAARLGHAVLYVLLFAVPLSGWMFDSLGGLRKLVWWGVLEMPKLAAPDKGLASIAEDVHEALFWILVAVAAGHAAAALWHHFHDRDAVLRRMLPGRRFSDTP